MKKNRFQSNKLLRYMKLIPVLIFESAVNCRVILQVLLHRSPDRVGLLGKWAGPKLTFKINRVKSGPNRTQRNILLLIGVG